MPTKKRKIGLIDVTVDFVSVVYLKHDDRQDKGRVTGRGKRVFAETSTITRTQTGKILRETFRSHVYRGELRVMIPSAGRYDERQSLTIDDFKPYAERRWGKRKCRPVLKGVQSIITGV